MSSYQKLTRLCFDNFSSWEQLGFNSAYNESKINISTLVKPAYKS